MYKIENRATQVASNPTARGDPKSDDNTGILPFTFYRLVEICFAVVLLWLSGCGSASCDLLFDEGCELNGNGVIFGIEIVLLSGVFG